MGERSRRTALAAAVLLVPAALAACGSSPSPSTSSADLRGQTITVYSGQHEQTTQLLVKDFEARSGVTVKLKSDDEASLAGQLLQEGDASPADVFYAENPPALTTVEKAGLLAATDSATLSQTTTGTSSTTGDWVAVSGRTAAFAANAALPAVDLPRSVLDLAAPTWKGRLGLAPAETDFAPIVTEVIDQKGVAAAKAWLEGLKRNGTVYPDNETLIAAIDRGEVAGGIVDHYYWYRLRDEVGAASLHTTLHYFATGDPGALVDVSGAGALRSSRHPAAAQAFLAYLVSAPAQRIIATSHSYEYPLRPGVESATALRPLAKVGSFAAPASLGDGKAALSLLQDVGLF